MDASQQASSTRPKKMETLSPQEPKFP